MRERNNVGSTSRHMLSRLYREVPWEPQTVNLDLGAGRYELATRYLAERGVENLPLDPANRSLAVNRATLARLRARPADTCTAANVLHVIEEEEIRLRLVHRAWRLLKPGGRFYVSVWCIGVKRRRGLRATGSFNRDAPLRDYLPELHAYFGDVRRTPCYVVARKEG